MSYIDNSSGERDGDRYLKMYEENGSLVRKQTNFPEVHEDTHALAEITISSVNSNPITCIVSKTEGCILYSPTRMQISKASPVGAYIANNLRTIKVGTLLPNGSTILDIAYINFEE